VFGRDAKKDPRSSHSGSGSGGVLEQTPPHESDLGGREGWPSRGDMECPFFDRRGFRGENGLTVTGGGGENAHALSLCTVAYEPVRYASRACKGKIDLRRFSASADIRKITRHLNAAVGPTSGGGCRECRYQN
jgi:hypothetical protein